MNGAKTPSAEEIEAARRSLDAHVREMVGWHFGERTGCPFWLEFAAGLDFDPVREIGGYRDLELLGHFQDEWLRGGPVRRWLPRGFAGEHVSVFETGGPPAYPSTASTSAISASITSCSARLSPRRPFHAGQTG